MPTLIRQALASLLLLAAIALPSSSAAQVYSNGPLIGSGGNSINSPGYWLFDDFFFTSAHTLSSMRFWSLGSVGFGPVAASGTVDWEIRGIGSGGPGALIASGVGTTSNIFDGPDCCTTNRYVSDFALSVSLPAGLYWIGLSNATGGAAYWEIASQIFGSGSVIRQTNSPDLFEPYDYAFELYETSVTTPEPATLALIVPGLLGLAAVRRRRRK